MYNISFGGRIHTETNCTQLIYVSSIKIYSNVYLKYNVNIYNTCRTDKQLNAHLYVEKYSEEEKKSCLSYIKILWKPMGAK